MTFAVLLAALTLAGIVGFMVYYFDVLHPRKNTLDWVELQEARRPFSFARPRYPMVRRDALAALIITAVYAVTAFFSLGDTVAPQEFVDFGDGKTVTIRIDGDPVYATGIRYYCGLGTGVEYSGAGGVKTNVAYNVEISQDGETWYGLWQRRDDENDPGKITGYYWAGTEGFQPAYAMTQTYSELFKWHDIQLDNPLNVSYIRISGKAGTRELMLGKFLLLDRDGRPAAIEYSPADGSAMDEATRQLFALDDTVPREADWRNSTYFDEIYHARTALEHLEGVEPYEWTHPPLGKLIIGLGIQMFGMTPFGWRFMGTLFGVLMLPVLYVFLKNLFGKTAVAACGTILFACDFMHLTQTRIATIDTYGVFFILLSYFFFYRWLTASATPNRKGKTGEGYGSLALSGVFFGVGVASKWTVLYAGAGLAVLYAIHVIVRLVRWSRSGERGMWVWLFKTLGVSVLCFVAVPVAVYTLSYLPYVLWTGDEVTLRGLWDEMIRNQIRMFNYHQGAKDFHSYSSHWYQWIVDARPILYYSRDLGGGIRESFSSFNNPVVSWAGLAAMVFVAVRTVQRRCGKGLFILLGYLAQLLPWTIIGRTTFAYHYFPSMLFLVLAISYLFNDLVECPRAKWRWSVYGLTGGAVALYGLFYPVLVGLAIPSWYATGVLKWFPSWPIW